MKVDMLMPQMGESITEATISRWLKQPGDAVDKDEIILESSTDKVDSEIPAPEAGVLVEVLFTEGDVVPVKERIAIIDTEASAETQQSSPAPDAASQQAPEPQPVPQADTAQVQSTQASSADAGRFYSPLVRSLAAKHGLDVAELAKIPGTGANGRVTKNDLLAYLEDGASSAAPSVAAAPIAPQASTARPAARAPTADIPGDDWSEAGEKVVPFDNMRQAIAEHMVMSKQTSPHVYSVTEVNVSVISAWRAKHKGRFKEKEGFNLSFTPFFLEAAVQGLLEFPEINASVVGNKLVLKRHLNLGCAVALGNKGLIVPVIKRAEEKNLVGIARGLSDLALRARNKKLLPDDVQGGTFTVTNPGVFGTVIGYPIINQPQLAILSLGAIAKRPVVIGDMIAIREMCYLTLSYDHRVIDGSLGGSYLKFVRDYLQAWDIERPLY